MRRERFVVAFIGAVLLSAASFAQQPARDAPTVPSTGTASISGTVVINEPGGGPLRRATVSLSVRTNTVSVARQTTTDDQGRFVFANLPAATYSPPTVAKPGFVTSSYGETRPGGVGTPLTLAEGQKLSVAFRLLRGAVITGRLADAGHPVAQTNVNAVPIRMVNGRRTASSGRSFSAQTDDRGIYRIYGLSPGDYLVSASPRRTVNAEIRLVTDAELQWAAQQLSGGGGGAIPAPGFGNAAEPPPSQPLDYAPVFYPGTGDAAAAVAVSVAAGQERSGIDFNVTYVPTAKIEGVVLDAGGAAAANVQINIVPLMADDAAQLGPISMFDTMMLMTRPNIANGRFSFAGIRPGRYTVFARAAAPGEAPAAAPGRGRGGTPPLTLWASQDLTVEGRDLTGLELRLQPGLTLRGRVTFDSASGTPPEDLSRLSFRLTPAPTAGYTVTVNPPLPEVSPDGTFRLEGVAPGKYVVNASLPGGQPPWMLRSARVGEIDAADVGFDVRPNQAPPEIELLFTTRTAELSGRLLDGTGKPSAALSIFLFSVDPQQWSQRTRWIRPPVRAGTDGSFRFTNLLPGEYYLAALSDFDQADIFQPDFLEQVAAAAMKIAIGEGEKKAQDIRIR